MLEDQDGVGLGEGREQEPARVGRRRGREHREAGDVRVPALEAVRVLRRELPAGAGRHADHERHAELAARHVPERRRVVDDLVERQQAEVDRHHLDDRAQAPERRADAGADERALRERRVAHAVGAELLQQAAAHRVGAAVAPHVLAHQEHPRVPGERLAQGAPHRVAVRQLGHGVRLA